MPTEKRPGRLERKKQRKSQVPSKYAPQMWPTWLVVGLAWCIAHLPTNWIGNLGKHFGNLMFHVAKPRTKVTQRNIQRCFPELDAEQEEALVRENFRQLGMGTLEIMLPWLNPKRDLSDRFQVEGVEHLNAAVAKGRGVIIVGAHYASMDIISAPLKELEVIDVMYRWNKNPVWEWLQVSGRQRYFKNVIEREDTRAALRCLKQGRALWYAADQDYGAKHSVFAPFFGIQAATIVATQRFARLNNSPVLLMRQTRMANMTWQISFMPELTNFPSKDDQADAARLNACLETEIRKYPSQYMWLHKRFKTRPPGEEDFYA